MNHNGSKRQDQKSTHSGYTRCIGNRDIFPIWFLIVNSFKGQQEIVASPIALPKSWNLDYLKNAAEQINLGSSLLQTVLITVAAVALIVVISSFAAWAIARTDSKVANILFIAYTAAMLIPFQSVMYPLVSLMDKLGLKTHRV